MQQWIDIFGKRYRINEVQRGCGGSRSLGEANHSSLTIDLASGQAEAQKRDTLLHEVIHGIEYAMHLELEERQVHALAAGLLCVMRANPAFVRWLVLNDVDDPHEG